MSACFEYGQKEIEYLKSKDKKLAACIERIGHIKRAVDTDLFSSVVHHIIGQQISTKAQATIWQQMQDSFGEVIAETIGKADITRLQSFGMTFRKAEYIQDFARKVESGSFDLNTVLRGLRMVYRHRKISKDLFEKYRRRFSPCCSVASLYLLWAVAGGAMEELTDPAAKFQTKKEASRKNGARDRIV